MGFLLMPCQTESGDHLLEEWERNQKMFQVMSSPAHLPAKKTALEYDLVEDHKDLWSCCGAQ